MIANPPVRSGALKADLDDWGLSYGSKCASEHLLWQLLVPRDSVLELCP